MVKVPFFDVEIGKIDRKLKEADALWIESSVNSRKHTQILININLIRGGTYSTFSKSMKVKKKVLQIEIIYTAPNK